MSMPSWLRAAVEPKTQTAQKKSEPACIIAPTAEKKDPSVQSLAEHDAKFHPNGLKPTESCKFREQFVDEPATDSSDTNPKNPEIDDTPFFQEISAKPMFEAPKKTNKKPGRKAKK